MNSNLIHDYGELKLHQIIETWRNLKKDSDYCWTLDLQIEELSTMFKEFMKEDYKEKSHNLYKGGQK